MDLRDDRHVPGRTVRGSYLHYHDHYRRADNFVQRGYRHHKRAEQSTESALHESLELVFPRRGHVLPLRRERHLLLQAYRSSRPHTPPVCYPPPLHQFRSVHLR